MATMYQATAGRSHGRVLTLDAIVGVIGGWIERAKSRAALAALDDRLLRDIGLTRADVADETFKPFWR